MKPASRHRGTVAATRRTRPFRYMTQPGPLRRQKRPPWPPGSFLPEPQPLGPPGASALAVLPNVPACAASGACVSRLCRPGTAPLSTREGGGRQSGSLCIAPTEPGVRMRTRGARLRSRNVTADAELQPPGGPPPQGGATRDLSLVPAALSATIPTDLPHLPLTSQPKLSAFPARAPKPVPSSRERPPPCPSLPRVTPVGARLAWLSG